MKERPILFKGEMIRAVLAGTKTQTRRVVKPQPCPQDREVDEFVRPILIDGVWSYHSDEDEYGLVCSRPCPYGAVGARLWVREMFQPLLADGHDSLGDTDYKTGKGYAFSYPATDGVQEYVDLRTDSVTVACKPSIHMPRWASRILLEVTEVRVERVQEITEGDAYAEGISGGDAMGDPVGEFAKLWDSINAKRGPFAWSENPWVWVVEFKRSDSAQVGADSTDDGARADSKDSSE